MRELFPLSPTAIETHNDCARKWHYVYVGGHRSPPSASTEIGNQVHAQIEAFYKSGQNTLGPLAIRLQPYLHPELPHVVERTLAFHVDGTRFKGRADLITYGHTIDDAGDVVADAACLEVTDHKTGKSPYAKTPHDLATNLQGAFYLYGAALERPDATRFYFAHNFTATDRVYAHRRRVLFADSRDELHEKFATRVLAAAQQIRATFATPKVDDVAANIKACDAYGGCHLKPICKAYSRHVMAQTLQTAHAAEKEDSEVSLLDEVLEASTPKTEEAQIAEIMRSLDQGRYPTSAKELVWLLWDKFQGYPKISGNLAIEYGAEIGQKLTLFPGEGIFAHTTATEREHLIALFPRDFFGKPHTEEDARACLPAKPVEEIPPPPPTTVEAPSVAPPPPPGEAEPAKRGRGRPRKSDAPPAPRAVAETPDKTAETQYREQLRDQLAASGEATAPAAATDAPEAPKPAAPATTAPLTWLFIAYVDCVIEGVEAIDLGPLAQRVIDACNGAFQTLDLRLKDEDALAYGRWRAIVQTTFVHTVQQEIAQGSIVRLHAKYSALLGPCVDGLRQLAAVKVFGV